MIWTRNEETRAWDCEEGDWKGHLFWIPSSYGLPPQWRYRFTHKTGVVTGGGLRGNLKREEAAELAWQTVQWAWEKLGRG